MQRTLYIAIGLLSGLCAVLLMATNRSTQYSHVFTPKEFIVSRKSGGMLNNTTGTLPDVELAKDSEFVSAPNQKAGTVVRGVSVQTKQTSWIVIHEILDNDSAGPIIGTAHAPSGQSENLSIYLLSSTKQGKLYGAVLYTDDGNDIFDVGKDTVRISDVGTILSSLFTTF